jgi:hypothetical protein
MARSKQISIVAVAFLLLLSVSAPSAAWAQNAPPTGQGPSTGQKVAAGFSNVLYVPMKALIICPIGGGVWLVGMILTGGGQYNEAANFVAGACGGKWVIKAEDIHFNE